MRAPPVYKHKSLPTQACPCNVCATCVGVTLAVPFGYSSSCTRLCRFAHGELYVPRLAFATPFAPVELVA